MATPIDPAGAASAALNTQANAVQRPAQTQQVNNTQAPINTENMRPAESSGDVSQTQQVNPGNRLGNFIDITV